MFEIHDVKINVTSTENLPLQYETPTSVFIDVF